MARRAKKEQELDKELLKEVEALIDSKAEHVKSTDPFLEFCVRLFNIKPEVDKDFQQSLRQRLLDRYQEFILQAPASKTEALRARGIGFHEAVNKIKGGVAMLRSKKALAGAVAGVIMLIVGFAVLTPFGSQSPEVLAQEIAEQDPQVQAFLDEGGTLKEVVHVEEAQGDFYRVTFELPEHPEKGQGQTIVNALVDVEYARIVKVEKGYIAPLTEEQKERAIQIAKSDSRVQEFLDRGATIYKVTSLPSFGSLEEEHLPTLAGVALELQGEEVWGKMFVEVNLTEGEVVNVLKDEQELTVPQEKILTEEEQARAREIAEADPGVQEILQSGATIVGVFPTIDEGIVDLAIIADHPNKRSWSVRVDLEEGKVVEVKEDVVEVIGGIE